MKKRKWIWIGLAVILIASVLLLSNPQIRTNLFVRLYHDNIEEGLRMNAGVPADDAVLFGYRKSPLVLTLTSCSWVANSAQLDILSGLHLWLQSRAKAHRAGKRMVRRMIRKGANPYLKTLSSMLNEESIAGRIELGIMDIPTDRIVGITAEEKRTVYSNDFLPLSRSDGDFASKWCKLNWYFFSNEAARCPVTCYEYMGEFYIIDGVKRVSIAKCHDIPTITASVTRILPVYTKEESVIRYIQFLKTFKQTGLYQIEFTKPGSFVQFQEALGHTPDYVWNEEDRVNFLFNWYVFEQAFYEAFDGYLRITPADAFLILLEEHPYEKLREMPPLVLVHLMRNKWNKLYALHKEKDIQMDVLTADTTMHHSEV